MTTQNLVVGTDDCSVYSVVSLIDQDETIIEKWTVLARSLDISSTEIKKFSQNLLLDKISHSDLIHDIMERWVTRKADNAKLAILILLVEEECGAHELGGSLRLYFNLPMTKMYDLITWEDLTPALQSKVKNNLDEFLPGIRIENIRSILNGSLLVHMIKGIPQTLPEPLSYYINRTVLTRNVISTSIFDKNVQHIFLVSGMERYELSRFAKDKTTDNSSNQIKLGKLTVGHMIMDSPGHFAKLCKLTSDPVHWFRWGEGKLKWIQSRGGISAIQECVDDGSQDSFNEEDFCKNLRSNSNQPVCISDSPGMGKSVFLAEVARRLKRLYPERTVIFLVFNELINEIRQIDFESVLKSFQTANDKAITIELLLDGLDEVDPSNMMCAKEVLQWIRINCKTVRVWVTTRPHFLTPVEVILETIGFHIQPFSSEDQLQFLTKYWHGKQELNLHRLRLFAQDCLRNLQLIVQTSMISDLAGIPLQCLLIAEVYKDDAADFADESQEDFASSSKRPVLPFSINSVSDLYKSLIEKKFQKKSGSIQPQTLMDMHAYLSLEVIFPGRLCKWQKLFDFDEIDHLEIVKIGLLEGSNKNKGLLRFVHRTFAEYFVAWFVVNRLQIYGWIDKFSFFDILDFNQGEAGNAIFTHSVIIYFVDRMLNNLDTFSTDSGHTLRTIMDCEPIGKQLAYSCANSDCLNILNYFLKLDAFAPHESSCFDETFFLYCIRASGLELVKVVLAEFEIHHEFKDELQRKALCEAVNRGEFSIVEFLIKERQLLEMIKVSNFQTRLLLHDCVKCARYSSEATRNGKLQIMQMLVDINPSLLEAKDRYQQTPLVITESHTALKLRLIDMGANVRARGHFSRTVLHLTYYYVSPVDYQALVSAIPEGALRELVRVETSTPSNHYRIGRTALHTILSEFNPLPETLDAFQQAGADFNFVDDDGYSILAASIRTKRNGKTIRKLIECGANVRWTRGWKRTTLLHIAAVSKNPEAVAVLLNWIDRDVRDLKLRTPKYYAKRTGGEHVRCFELGLELANKRDGNWNK